MPTLGRATGDRQLIELALPLVAAAGVRDRISIVHVDGLERREAHFGAGPNTVYEIGSVTKTMTSMIFAAQVDAGTLRADTTAGSLLDLGSSHAADVTLEELASHRSGLPRIAGGLPTRASATIAVVRHRNPYTVGLPELLVRAKASKGGARGRFSYSNLGAALLGQALAAHAKIDYPALVDRHLFSPLGMSQSTTPVFADDLPPRAPAGWNAHGRAEQPWAMGAYAPAGGVRSTPADMARYARALLDRTAPGLVALEPRWNAGGLTRLGYAWFTDSVDGVDVTWHNGATGGFSSMLALDRRHCSAVVVLANTAATVDGLALRVLLDAPGRVR